jgi:Fe-S-cluster containining protein
VGNNCSNCRFYAKKEKVCFRYPKWLDIRKPELHFCGEHEKPIAVMKPPTKEELEAKNRELNRPVTDAERRERAKESYGPPRKR